MVKQFEPKNPLEFALADAQSGNRTIAEFLPTFLDSQIAIPSSQIVEQDGRGMSPVFFDKNGIQMVAAFTELDRALTVSNLAHYCLTMKGRELLIRMPPGYGLVINPGFDVGFDIAPEGIQEILRDFPIEPLAPGP
jgi:hypothetical protein